MISTNPIEGFFIVSDEGLIFEVKGNIQPDDRVIAYLRYIPDKEGTRVSANGMRYRKIYGLEKREAFLRKNYAKYLWHSDIHDCIIQAVPKDSIAFVLNPIDVLQQIRDMGRHVSQSQNAVRELAEVLVDEAGISWSDIGITGSHLVGLQTTTSDIDLVVYGSSASRKLHARLSCRESVPGIVRYHGKDLERHLQFRWPDFTEWKNDLRKIESEKHFQGMFASFDFYIRAVKQQSEVQYSFHDLSFERKGECVIEGRVLSDTNSIFTPCSYCVECFEFPDLLYLVSFRGRFTEHVKEGMKVRARGNLETVVDKASEREYMQLVLGGKSSDFLIPI